MECKVKLLDQDFLTGRQRKLNHLAYGVSEITKSGDVSYSGDTFIRIRSGKQNISNAFAHTVDVRELFQTNLVKGKPVFLTATDVAQD